MRFVSGRRGLDGARVQGDLANERKLAGVTEPIERCPL
jgi:hypothetical protein